MKRICVFCGSSPGAKPEYIKAAQELGDLLVKNNIGLVYGGGKVGMMGQIAKTMLEAEGEVIGIIPKALMGKEVAFMDLENLHVVNSMHERKAMMADFADAFIAMPGGLGTIEELIEVLTWAQLGIHKKPCGLFNVCNYFDKMIDFLEYIVDQQFMQQNHRDIIIVEDKPENLIKKFKSYQPPTFDKIKWALKMNNY